MLESVCIAERRYVAKINDTHDGDAIFMQHLFSEAVVTQHLGLKRGETNALSGKCRQWLQYAVPHLRIHSALCTIPSIRGNPCRAKAERERYLGKLQTPSGFALCIRFSLQLTSNDRSRSVYHFPWANSSADLISKRVEAGKWSSNHVI